MDMRILVADDHETIRRIVAQVLKQLGYTNIEVADDGSTALPMLQAGKFDFLVSGWNMLIMQSINLLKAVRANEKTGKIPVLLVTAEAKPAQIVAASKGWC